MLIDQLEVSKHVNCNRRAICHMLFLYFTTVKYDIFLFSKISDSYYSVYKVQPLLLEEKSEV